MEMVLTTLFLAEAAQSTGRALDATVLVFLFVIGFIAAVTLGSIAWYNSRRPPGWETKERPDIVPPVDGSVEPRG
ncbi:MAG TPA: hypothetical protein IGS53_09610 [Leptolyngbyaceae cyanobacterium M33_DOE_097]|uniref:Uncharacterized protein n=1 Tax=Oscillatoriales cyanobacterium SpSt-418 TaxID=2282169 RepID=A0A7C3PIX2_9CYAN|nr:hypothetical protein [Leptolyngbyaceae cyanobacterium M33_DOE_097]